MGIVWLNVFFMVCLYWLTEDDYYTMSNIQRAVVYTTYMVIVVDIYLWGNELQKDYSVLSTGISIYVMLVFAWLTTREEPKNER